MTTINHNISGVNTNSCIAGDQFARLKKGDRYFYDLEGFPGSFTSDQLQQIRKASLARILCDNSGVDQIQPLPFFVPSESNPVLSCDNLSAVPRPNLKSWTEFGSNNEVRRG